MANNKMLIDATHREETRVAVVRGNRVEEFDFEAQERKQLRGNIYLAKVTRVEPSLQAAFIDYGGNRHGFLAFAEIHPDYYQIPAADRQALLAEEEAAAAAAAKAEEEIDLDIQLDDDEDEAEESKPAGRSRRKPRRNRSRRSRGGDVQADGDGGESESENDGNGDEPVAEAAEPAAAESGDTPVDEESAAKPRKTARRGKAKSSSDDEIADESEEKPKKKTTRSRKKKADPDSEEGNSDTTGGTTIAAVMDIDSISEPAPDDDGDDGEGSDAAEQDGEEKKPARKRKPRKPRKKAAEMESDEADEVTAAAEDSSPEGPADETVSEDEEQEESENGASAEDAPRKSRRSRRRKPRKQAEAASDEDGDDDDSDDEEADSVVKPESVQSAGGEDAIEEAQIRRPRRQYKIQEVIRRRQVMLVQVVKEERGNKGAALTTYLSLAGRYSVLMPNTARGGGISRKITNPADRKRLKEIAHSLEVPKGMGVILRTAGASQEADEIQRDFDYLMRLWDNVRNLTLASSAPFLVYEEGSLIKRSIRDLYNKDISEVIVAGEEGYREARDFMKMLMPDHAKNVSLYKGDQPLFSRFNVESQLEKLVAQQVTLKSGGYLVINQTEALVAIDVNSGKSTREHSIEATALQTNLEAAEEVARQLRLRDLAGLIVIDFIDMEEKRNNRAVERKLKDCLKNDRARIQVGHISHFGLLEMSRQRIRASVLESTMAVCPVCNGVGHVRSQSSQALMILRALEEHLMRNQRNDAIVKVPHSMALYILNNKRQALIDMEKRYGLSITIDGVHGAEEQGYLIERGGPARGELESGRPVSMSDNNDQEIPDEPISEEQEAAREDGRDGDRQSKRGRRRRGRGRDRNREGGYSREGEERFDESGNASADTTILDEQEDTDSEEDDVAANPVVVEQEKPVSGKTPTGKNAKPVSLEDSGESESRRPRRQTGRPGKKAKSEAESTASNGSDASAADSSMQADNREAAPPREMQRRNTRRVRSTKQDAAETAGNPVEAGSDAAENVEGTGEDKSSGWSGFLS